MAWQLPRAQRSRWLNVTRVVLIVAAAFLALSAPVATLASKRTDEAPVHVRAAAGVNPGQVPAIQGSSNSTAESGVTTDAAGNVWYHVVSSKMPKPKDVKAPKSAKKEAPAPPPPPAGQVIAQFAQAYLGYPYVWAGNGPYGFDCSGFTQFVILNTLGIDIGHAVAGQPYAGGAWVDWGNWMSGDLIFFQNTYAAGVSHVGIYIGDGLFIHAENPSTGVTISSVYSGYYAGHYWGSTRLA
jgi:cell wall-associated NlpC family hydrolase